MAGIIPALALVLGIAAVCGWWSGMWRAVGRGFHGSLGPIALAFATAAGFLGLMSSSGVLIFSAFPAPPSIDFVTLVAEAVPYAVLYLVYMRAPFDHHRVLTAAVFDRILDGTGVRRAYSQRRAGAVMRDLL